MAIERGGMLLDETTGDFVGFKTPGTGKDVYVPRFSDGGTGLVGTNSLIIVPVNARSYGVKADGVALYNCTTTASATCTVSDSAASFRESDVGKVCVVISYADSANTVRYGTISAVASDGLSCTAALNSSPGALTGARFVYGSDDTTALNAFLADGGRDLPSGIICLTSLVTVPDGTEAVGRGRLITGNFAKNFYYGAGHTSLVLCGNIAAGYFVKVGDNASTDTYGALLADCNVDGMRLAAGGVIGASGRVGSFERVTGIRNQTNANNYVFTVGAGGKMHNCIAISQQGGPVVSLSGDSKCTLNQIFGAGNGYYNLKISAADDVLVDQCHMWKDSGFPAVLGGSVYIENWGNTLTAGGVTVRNNKFDTAHASHIKIASLAGTAGETRTRGIAITNNQSMNNNDVAANTYPWIDFDVAAGDTIRGLQVLGNIVRGSWANASLGGQKYFIDGAGIAGNVYGTIVQGNFIDDLGTSPYNSFTPSVGTNTNAYMQTGSTTVTAF